MAERARSAPRLRRAAWSDWLTKPLARTIPKRRQRTALAVIKALHTLIFASVGTAIALLVWDGARQQTGRRAAYALGLATIESVIYLSNNQVCPLTPLAEDLGVEQAHVADMYLPTWAARCIPLVSTLALVTGLLLNARVLMLRRS